MGLKPPAAILFGGFLGLVSAAINGASVQDLAIGLACVFVACSFALMLSGDTK